MTLTGVTACTARRDFWATVYNGSPYPTCLSCPVLSVTFVYCGQTVGSTKMPLGAKVSLGPCHIVLDGDAFPPRKGAQPPLSRFTDAGSINHSPRLLWPNGGRSQQLLSSCCALWPAESITYVDTASVNMRSTCRRCCILPCHRNATDDALRLTGATASTR